MLSSSHWKQKVDKNQILYYFSEPHNYELKLRVRLQCEELKAKL